MPDAVARAVEPFRARPREAGIFTDFDGTLSPIVDDPASARPLATAAGLLGELARSYKRVAVVSGRPVSFLVEHLRTDADVVFVGLYGVETAAPYGTEIVHPDAERWRAVVAEVARAAVEQAPDGVLVEPKGLSLTVHVRTAPEHDGWARRFSEAQAGVTGLVLHPARQSYELRPPVPVDKGSVVGQLAEDLELAAFVGDDRGDLPAFDVLDRMAASGATVCKVAVRSEESPADLLARADLVVDGPPGAVDFLRALLP